MDHLKIDGRARFRLHALDLWRAPARPCDHWMLRRGSALRGWLADMARDYGRLRRAGGDPFDGRPITGCATLSKLGFASREEPQGAWEQIQFAADMLVASTRAAWRVQRELLMLSRRSRSQA